MTDTNRPRSTWAQIASALVAACALFWVVKRELTADPVTLALSPPRTGVRVLQTPQGALDVRLDLPIVVGGPDRCRVIVRRIGAYLTLVSDQTDTGSSPTREPYTVELLGQDNAPPMLDLDSKEIAEIRLRSREDRRLRSGLFLLRVDVEFDPVAPGAEQGGEPQAESHAEVTFLVKCEPADVRGASEAKPEQPDTWPRLKLVTPPPK